MHIHHLSLSLTQMQSQADTTTESDSNTYNAQLGKVAGHLNRPTHCSGNTKGARKREEEEGLTVIVVVVDYRSQSQDLRRRRFTDVDVVVRHRHRHLPSLTLVLASRSHRSCEVTWINFEQSQVVAKTATFLIKRKRPSSSSFLLPKWRLIIAESWN